jgi:hypothetical protein
VEVIPHPKELGVKYSFHVSYRLFRRRQFGRYACGSTPAFGRAVRAFGAGVFTYGLKPVPFKPKRDGWMLALGGAPSGYRSGLQPLVVCWALTWAVGPGWYRSGLWPSFWWAGGFVD